MQIETQSSIAPMSWSMWMILLILHEIRITGSCWKGYMKDLKCTRYIRLYSMENIPDKYREEYEELEKPDLQTGNAYYMKEDITGLWNVPSIERAGKYWESWYNWIIHSPVDAMNDVARMMKAHLDKILNYFIHRITNAWAERINSKIASIQEMA